MFHLILILSSFNPCFNGSSSYTTWETGDRITASKCFNPCFNGSSSYTVEVEVEEENKVETTLEYFELEMSFNPCFNGSSSYTSK